jgi:high-affinity iron transporter
MLLNSVIIILREVLEASLLTSLLLAMTHHLKLSMNWIIPSLIAGAIGALFYGINIAAISELNNYTGQEIINAACQTLIFFALLCLIYVINFKSSDFYKFFPLLMSLCVTLAITREGSEIYIYCSGFISNQEQFSSVFIGGLIGASIGISIGVIIYYMIIFNTQLKSFYISQLMLAIIASGILSQVIPMLMQVDLITAQSALWDSSFILHEESLIGQLTYAIAGYESTPTLLQVSVNAIALLTFLFLILLPRYKKSAEK